MNGYWKDEVYPVIKLMEKTEFVERFTKELNQSVRSVERYYRGYCPGYDALIRITTSLKIETIVPARKVVKKEPKPKAPDKQTHLPKLIDTYISTGKVIINKKNYDKWQHEFKNHTKIDNDNCWVLIKK